MNDVAKKPMAQERGLHVVGGKAPVTGIRRKSPKHLTRSERMLAVASYRQYQCEEDAAQAIGKPGVTGKTVLSAFLLSVDARLESLEQMLRMRSVA